LFVSDSVRPLSPDFASSQVTVAATAAARRATTKQVEAPSKTAAGKKPAAKKASPVKAVPKKDEAASGKKSATPAGAAKKAADTPPAKKTTGKAAKSDADAATPVVAGADDVDPDADPPEPTEPPEDEAVEGFVISEDDEEDAPAQQVATAGATADPVKDYLKQIGKVALLNAEQEVELAKRIEAGLFSEEKLNSGDKFAPKLKKELDWIAEDGRRAKNHLLEANLRLVVSLAYRDT